MSPEEEIDFLQRAQCELKVALDSLAGKQRKGLVDALPVFGAAHIHRTVDGFIVLRKAGRDYAARLLVRPVLETMFRLLAIECRPEVCYRIARDEFEEDRKWIRSIAPGDAALEAALDDRWRKFKSTYQGQFPNHDLTDAPIGARSIADWAKQGGYYDSHYRLYCQYTHATLRAVTDGLKDLQGEDVRAMCMPTIVAIRAVCRAGGTSENIGSLFEEFKNR